MYSVLVMVLAVGMMVGSGPKSVSEEVTTPQPLDLRDRWESTPIDSPGGPWTMALDDGKLLWYRKAELEFRWDFQIVDEGAGKFKMTYGSRDYLGIYTQENGRLVICYRAAHLGRPSEYKEGNKDMLYILHRVKPSK